MPRIPLPYEAQKAYNGGIAPCVELACLHNDRIDVVRLLALEDLTRVMAEGRRNFEENES